MFLLDISDASPFEIVFCRMQFGDGVGRGRVGGCVCVGGGGEGLVELFSLDIFETEVLCGNTFV